MTTPGGDSGENAYDDAKGPPSAEQPQQHDRGGSGEPAFSGREPPPSGFESPPTPSTSGYPPPAYPPPSYPQSGYPPPGGPPPGYPPPGYGDASSYGGGSYPPVPPEYGSSPGGYGQPYPGGYPEPDYPGGYGPPQSGTNTLAIASLISSLIGLLCGIGSIVGIVLGALALNQIKRTRQGGYGLAVAGIVVGIATLLVSLIITIYALR